LVLGVLIVLALVGGALLASGRDGNGLPPAETAQRPTLARVRLTIRTTSDWTKVRIRPTTLGSVTVTSNPSRVVAQPLHDGIGLEEVPPGGAAVEVVGILSESAFADPFELVVQKGARGETLVRFENFSADPYAVARTRNERHGGDVNETKTEIARERIFGGRHVRLPRADDRPLVLAAWYGWFGSALYDDARLADRPIDRVDAFSFRDVLRTTRQARAGGIDGFVVSWQGHAEDGRQFRNVLRAAHATGGVAAAYLETAAANASRDPSRPTSATVVGRWLDEALAQAHRDGFLRTDDGRPVVFVFEMARLQPEEWAGILRSDALHGDRVALVGDTTDRRYRGVQWGVHRYNPNLVGSEVFEPEELEAWNRRASLDARGPAALRTGSAQLSVATVSPGWDDRLLRGAYRPVVPRGEDGDRYRSTWDAAFAADADWILVTSWNEWFEGTSVQPGERNGDFALRQTLRYSARLHARADS